MQPNASMTPASILPVPKVDIDSDVPVAIIPTANVAPLDGPPDGERINTFTLAPLEDTAVNAYGSMRERVLSKPLTYVAAAFSLGFVFARMLR